MSAQADTDRRARVIARAVLQHQAKRTGDVDTMRVAALTLHATYESAPSGTTTPKETKP